MDIENVGCV